MRGRRWSARRAWPALGFAAPFAAAAFLGVGPSPVVAALAGALGFGLAARRAGRAQDTLRFARPPAGAVVFLQGLLRGVGWAAAGLVAALGLAGAWAASAPSAPLPGSERASAIYELDARIVTAPLPACAPRVASSRVLLDRGANPRVSPEGDDVWFDALAADGRRQVHRLSLAGGEAVCWTCEEAGNNQRPSPGEGGRAVAFDTDRFATPWTPFDFEIQLAAGRGERPSAPSTRLTIDPATDRAPVLGPGGQVLVWSRQEKGRSSVVGAGIRSGHGGILLGPASAVVVGGLSAVWPLAWSPDARSVVFVRGNPLGTQAAYRLDPATGVESKLGEGAVAAPAGTSADGGWLALPTSTDAGLAARLPGWLGFVLAPLALAKNGAPRALEGSGVRAGEPTAAGTALDLGALGGWGWPTGVSLAPDGRRLVLGQRRSTPGGVEERLVEARLDCDGAEPGA